MKKVFSACYAPSTLGSFLRAFTFGHVRQLDAVASRVLTNQAHATPVVKGLDEDAVVDVDDTIIEVRGYAKEGAGFGHTRVRGLHALLATVTTVQAAPAIVAQRPCSIRASRPVLVRADPAFYGHPTIGAAVRAGADVSVTVRLSSDVRAAIATINEDAWTPIEYTDAVRDEATGAWISRAEVAEIPVTAFTAQAPSRHVPRRPEELRPGTHALRRVRRQRPPGWCSRSSRSTSPAPRPRSPVRSYTAGRSHGR